MSYTESTRAAEQNTVSAEVSTSTVVITMSNETNSWKKRHVRKKRLRLEGWPPGVSIPKELLEELEQAPAQQGSSLPAESSDKSQNGDFSRSEA